MKINYIVGTCILLTSAAYTSSMTLAGSRTDPVANGGGNNDALFVGLFILAAILLGYGGGSLGGDKDTAGSEGSAGSNGSANSAGSAGSSGL